MDPKTQTYLIRGGIAAGVVGFLALVGPIIGVALVGAAGLFGIGIMAVLGIATIKMLPLLGQKWENKVIQMQIAEAEKNPIQQMWNRIEQRGAQLTETEKFLTTVGGQIGAMKRMIRDQKIADPGYDASDEDAAIVKMEQFFTDLKMDYQEALKALDAMKLEFKRKKFKWGFSEAADNAMAAMSVQDAASMRAEMLKDVAFQAVETRFESTFAKLDVKTLKLNANKQLSFGKGVTLDVSAVRIPTAQAQLMEVSR